MRASILFAMVLAGCSSAMVSGGSTSSTSIGSASTGSGSTSAESASGSSSSGAGGGSSGSSGSGSSSSSGSSGGSGSSGSTGSLITGSTYYLAAVDGTPPGSDANPGTHAQPLLTFAHAFSLMHAGDGLVLEDGTYTRSANGLPSVNCTASGLQGTASARITLMAEHERKALLQGDGHSSVLRLVNCNDWNVIGLHVEDADADFGNTYDTMHFEGDTHLLVRRNIVAHSNRCQNAHLMSFIYGCTNNLVEENELYYFHRHALIFYGSSDHNEARRNYANQRGYPAACNYVVANSGGMNYGGSGNLWENHITENSGGMNNETVGTCAWTATNSCEGGTHAVANAWLGCVSLHDTEGARSAPHTQGAQLDGIVWRDHVVVEPKSIGVYSRGSTNTVVDHASIFLSPMSVGGVVADQEKVDGGLLGSGSDSITVTNSFVAGAGAASFTAYKVLDSTGGTWSWSLTDLGASNVSALSNKSVSNPYDGGNDFGTCYLWAPDGSAAEQAGIGARVLYAIEDGGLTQKRLWDPVTGAPLFAGAIVPGLNDPGEDGGSLIDIAQRLHINQDGCQLPAGY